MNGKTIEVENTDAEGRLILADALCYARKLELSPIVDVATLTGAMSIILGKVAIGARTNDGALFARTREAAAAAGEKVWQLPLFDDYRRSWTRGRRYQERRGREAGSITAALFLKEFVDGAPWIHLDIAGVDQHDEVKGIFLKGSSGYGRADAHQPRPGPRRKPSARLAVRFFEPSAWGLGAPMRAR
jgi:leucyl aminopeptidase